MATFFLLFKHFVTFTFLLFNLTAFVFPLLLLCSLGALLSVGYDATYAAFVTKRPYTEVTYRNNQSTGIRLPDVTVCTLSGFWKSKMERKVAFRSSSDFVSGFLGSMCGVCVCVRVSE